MSKVLVVDDETDIRLLVRFYLESAGHEVSEAATGQEGIEALSRDRSDVILLDLRLPDMDGWSVLEEWSTLPEGERGRVVVMSAHASPTTLQRAENEGASGYIVKPFRESDLLRWVYPARRSLSPRSDVRTGGSSATSSTSCTSSARWKSISSRTVAGRSSRSPSLRRGRITSFNPER